MRIVGWPEESDSEGGILPMTISNVDFHRTPDELRLIANFLLRAAGELDLAQANNSELNVGVELGMRLIAAAGDIDVKALSDSINLLAKLNITHTANRITFTAKEEIQINGARSYATFNSQGIELGTSGSFRSHANDNSLLGPKNAATPDMPVVHRFQQEAKLKLSI
ncbi:DUF2345 domain-containing protein [Massilia luteola]|uniref:DUF2345 domain-containing protein n=1 Tax=Massilia luteola TaxID=3081751 RepID=UPI002ACC2F94|nr:DUF2345 domain-containing protein [Massilia sp. Gc5]